MSVIFQRVLQQEGFSPDWQTALESSTQIAAMQESLSLEKNAVHWYALAGQLKDMYIKKGLNNEAVLLAKQIYEHLKTLSSALGVIETCVAVARFDEAESVIRYFEAKYKGQDEVLAAIGVARCRMYLESEKPESARAAVRKINTDVIQTPEILFSLAKVQAATRQSASSVKTLTKCFKLTPPEILDCVKGEASHCKEFRKISDSYEFMHAMQTKSTLSSGCSACSRKWLTWQKLESPLSAGTISRMSNYTIDGICFGDWRIK